MATNARKNERVKKHKESNSVMFCRPIEKYYWEDIAKEFPQFLDPLAMLHQIADRPEGVLAKVKNTEEFAIWRYGSGNIKPFPKKQAELLLEPLKKENSLEAIIRIWLKKHNFTQEQGARELGIPKSTFEQILQGRGFKYPTLLRRAILSD